MMSLFPSLLSNQVENNKNKRDDDYISAVAYCFLLRGASLKNGSAKVVNIIQCSSSEEEEEGHSCDLASRKRNVKS